MVKIENIYAFLGAKNIREMVGVVDCEEFVDTYFSNRPVLCRIGFNMKHVEKIAEIEYAQR